METNMKTPTMVNFQQYVDSNGVLCVYESEKQVPFVIRRVFTVTAMTGDPRGDHAHKLCAQLLICVSGKIMVTCDNGFDVTNHVLGGMNCGLLVPAGIWAKQEYLTDGAVLMVLCDRGYEEEDYIRNYEDFKTFIATIKG
jgi:dTDP-4-dehydrorhamnose 3,5-epimerase-like enzyme